MLDSRILSRVLHRALARGADFAEIYGEERNTGSLFYEDGRLEKVNQGLEKGAGIRVVKNGNTAYVYTNDISEEGLLRGIDTAYHAAAKARDLDEELALRIKEAPFVFSPVRRPEEVEWEEKIRWAKEADRAARSLGEEIRQVTVGIAEVEKKVVIANTEGELVEKEEVRTRAVVNVVACKDGIMQTGYETAGGAAGWEILGEDGLNGLAVKAGDLALRLLEAKPAPAGRMPVVMAAEAGGTMVHEACGHGLEADLVGKGLSVYKDKKGKQVASELVTVIDDATLDKKYGSYVFDDEGVPGQRTILIAKGELKGYMYDRLTAARDGVLSTGNGRRESYQHKPVPRMSNTFIAPGNDRIEEIIRSTPYGLLVKKMGGGQVNTTNGDFVFEVKEGYLIRDGEVAELVRGATISGNGPEALLNVDRVGNDLGFAIGVCGKEGQGVPVADAQPTIRIKELTVGGIVEEETPAIKRIRRR
ncbi:microcin-processing peptidase 2. Unknown type peptidase. MEROPS family U62 [Thermosyntropha lipolytica DSM 11003]|uniref:TldD protein n=1 Tax=Thermosyntropha lipolytica DSM 11003 TaxID=1123382 RepID=A0A1M5LNW6_9FIRM|nr:TldD/PmbA family protein [Thermosyntropha lipolytica]SHG66043.1 microcin-processing peptidase 2. Unknown type peptidase. MEROPS family U62 [Thermosyntropha lipolytica DSM 11003]